MIYILHNETVGNATMTCKDIEDTCNGIGAKMFFDQFTFTIMFKDGKKLIYALNNAGKTVGQILDNVTKTIEEGGHGRIFSSDGKFLGYAPEKVSIDEIFIHVDLMLAT